MVRQAPCYSPPVADRVISLDDNAQVVIALLRAYEIPTVSRAKYLFRAQKVTDFLLTGWDAANGGGMKWHIGMTTRNACSTSLTAVAVLKLAKIGERTSGKTRNELIVFARTAVKWILDELQLDSGLIMDGIGGGPTYTWVQIFPHWVVVLTLQITAITPASRYMLSVFCKK